MRIGFFFGAAIVVVSVLFSGASCSNDGNPGDPDGTIAVNMMDESNGKTTLGNSDVYIDDALNFSGTYCSIASLGKKKGLGNLSAPALGQLGGKVAVVPGCGYQIFSDAVIREFPSGKLALDVRGDYYNVYVAGPIERDGRTVGATVKYAVADVPANGLPPADKSVGTINSYNNPIMIELPTSDFEYETDFASSKYYTLECEKRDNKLIIRLIEHRESDFFNLYIRVGGSYAYLHGRVEM